MQNNNIRAPVDFPIKQIPLYHLSRHFTVIGLETHATIRQGHEVLLLF
jgi:hypothetical protein